MEIKERSGDGTAKQEAEGEEYKQEAEQLLKLHRQDKIFAPSLPLLFGALSAYLLFVGAVTGVGMLASYTHHETTANTFLVFSIALLPIGLIGVLWYLVVTFRTKRGAKEVPKQQRWLIRLAQSRPGRFLFWIGGSRIRFIGYAAFIYVITDSIRRFPQHPRSSLSFTVFYLALFLFTLILEIVRWTASGIQRDVERIWEFNELTRSAVISLKDGVELAFKAHEGNAEAIKSIFGILDNMNQLTQLTTDVLNKQLDAHPAGDDEEG